jgi:transposase InsO family protein
MFPAMASITTVAYPGDKPVDQHSLTLDSENTSQEFTALLKDQGIRISMDGKGAGVDKVVMERLLRSLMYEAIYLHAYETVQRGSTLRELLQSDQATSRLPDARPIVCTGRTGPQILPLCRPSRQAPLEPAESVQSSRAPL